MIIALVSKCLETTVDYGKTAAWKVAKWLNPAQAGWR